MNNSESHSTKNHFMCCMKRPRHNKKLNRVCPVKTRPVNGAFIQKFLAEVIPCGGCDQVFDLGSGQLKIHCNLCEQFFHCKIAGKCRGENCQVINHSASYCVNCVSKVYDNNECLCKDCFKE